MIKVTDRMKIIYGSHMKEIHGKKNNILGTEIDLSLDGEVRLTLEDYLNKIVSDYSETIHGRVKTRSAEHLLMVKLNVKRVSYMLFVRLCWTSTCMV